MKFLDEIALTFSALVLFICIIALYMQHSDNQARLKLMKQYVEIQQQLKEVKYAEDQAQEI